MAAIGVDGELIVFEVTLILEVGHNDLEIRQQNRKDKNRDEQKSLLSLPASPFFRYSGSGMSGTDAGISATDSTVSCGLLAWPESALFSSS